MPPKLFFLLPLLVLAAGQAYVSRRLWMLLPLPNVVKVAILVLMAVAVVCFFIPFLPFPSFTNSLPLGLMRCIYQTGCSWLVILLYLFLTFLVCDIARWTKLMPQSWMTANPITSGVLLLSFVLLFVYAHLHYDHKQRVELNVDTRGKLSHPVRLVMVSDLHLGYHNTRSDLHRWLQLLLDEKPDAILIAGDIIDGSYRPVREERMAEEFRELSIPVIACVGNHDYLTGIDNDMEFCKEANIQVLRDSTLTLGNLLIAGRDDRMNPHRKPLKVILKNADRSKYILELDHQPYHLEQAEQAGVDFEFSGHTHRGQIWPFNWVTDAVYEDSFGPWQRGNTQYYVSSGLGIWGPKFRIGTQSEYVVLNLH